MGFGGLRLLLIMAWNGQSLKKRCSPLRGATFFPHRVRAKAFGAKPDPKACPERTRPQATDRSPHTRPLSTSFFLRCGSINDTAPMAHGPWQTGRHCSPFILTRMLLRFLPIATSSAFIPSSRLRPAQPLLQVSLKPEHKDWPRLPLLQGRPPHYTKSKVTEYKRGKSANHHVSILFL